MVAAYSKSGRGVRRGKGEPDTAIGRYRIQRGHSARPERWHGVTGPGVAPTIAWAMMTRPSAISSKAIQLMPNSGRAYYGRAVLYEKKGEKAKAEEDFAQARSFGYKPEY